MRCKLFRTILMLAILAPALLLRAADPKADAAAKVAAEAKAKAEAEAKSKAEAEAAAAKNGAAYAEAKAQFDAWITSNQLDKAATAARGLLDSAAKPGKGAWRNPAQTYDYVTKALGDKKIFGRKQAIAFFEEGISKLTGEARSDLLLRYADYLETYALADEARVAALIEQAFADKELTDAQRIAICRRAGQQGNWSKAEDFAPRALIYAGTNAQAQVGIWQWRFLGNRRKMTTRQYAEAFEAVLNDKALKDHIFAFRGLVHSYVGELIYRREFDRALAWLDKVPEDVDARTRRSFLGQRAELHQKADQRYFDQPDPEGLKLAIATYETIIAEIPTNRPRDVIPYQVSIAETALQAGDTARAEATATETLKLIDQPGNRESHQLFYVLGRLAYEAEDYAKAVTILEDAYGHIRGKPGNFPKRREMVEDLVRAACAIGDYAKAADYADDLLELVRSYEKRRYQTYVEGLKKRVPDAKAKM